MNVGFSSNREKFLRSDVYPLPNDGDLSGVISIIMASIACLSPNFVEHVSVTLYGSKKNFPYLIYGKYLRSFLPIWMVESHINIQRVVPTSWQHSLAEVQISSDPDHDIRFSMSYITILRMRKFLLKTQY